MQRTKVEEDSQRATTPAYRAPEICDLYSNFPIDQRQDMWALGCLLFGFYLGLIQTFEFFQPIRIRT